LSQSGMVRHWLREGKAVQAKRVNGPSADGLEYLRSITAEGDKLDDIHVSVTPETIAGRNPVDLAVVSREASHWRRSIIINGLGAIATSIVLVVLIITKFIHGAWIVIFLIPLLVLLFRAVHHHYVEVARQLTTEGLEELRPIKHEVIVPISGIHRGVIRALE